MSGCYGNNHEDRYWENRLINHLDSEKKCEKCNSDDITYDTINGQGIFKCQDCDSEEFECAIV